MTNAATGLANVKALVYVDAFIPDEGQAVGALTGAESALAAAATDPTSLFKLAPYPGAPTGVVDTYLLPEVVATSFANDLTPEQAALITATQRPASLISVAEPSGPPAWKHIPAWAVIGTARPDHHACRAAPDGGACRCADHRGGRVARVDGLEAGCDRRGHPDGGVRGRLAPRSPRDGGRDRTSQRRQKDADILTGGLAGPNDRADREMVRRDNERVESVAVMARGRSGGTGTARTARPSCRGDPASIASATHADERCTSAARRTCGRGCGHTGDRSASAGIWHAWSPGSAGSRPWCASRGMRRPGWSDACWSTGCCPGTARLAARRCLSGCG